MGELKSSVIKWTSINLSGMCYTDKFIVMWQDGSSVPTTIKLDFEIDKLYIISSIDQSRINSGLNRPVCYYNGSVYLLNSKNNDQYWYKYQNTNILSVNGKEFTYAPPYGDEAKEFQYFAWKKEK